MTQAPILIAGGGITGLTLALALHEAGYRPRVLEAVANLAELGVGINVLPHAAKEFERLGVLGALVEEGVELERYIWFNRHGQEIWRESRGRSAGYVWPQVSIHRGALHRVLAAAVRARLGDDAIALDHQVTGFEQDAGGVTVRLASRATGTVRASLRCAILIGADGIHSALRRCLFPDEGPPRWAGNMMWRMCVELPAPVLGGSTMFAAGTGELKVVGYEISAAARRRGRSLFNWIAEVRTGTDGAPAPEREDWNRVAEVDEFIDHFSAFRFDWLDVPALARASGRALAFPMVDRDPLPRWTHGRVSLLGDAAHPMWPIGSNGASQGVLDCRVLVDALQAHADPCEALMAYAAQRLPATAAVVSANRSRAHDEILDLVESRAPAGFSDARAVIGAEEIEARLARYRQTAQFDRRQLQGTWAGHEPA